MRCPHRALLALLAPVTLAALLAGAPSCNLLVGSGEISGALETTSGAPGTTTTGATTGTTTGNGGAGGGGGAVTTGTTSTTTGTGGNGGNGSGTCANPILVDLSTPANIL